MADHESLVEQFVNVTGVESSRAQFYLESAAWDLQLAMESFYDSRFEDGDDVEIAEPSVNEDVSMGTDLSRRDPPQQAETNRMGTLRSLNVDSDSSEEEGQAYYAGGSDRSGQQVLGPPKKKDPNRLVESLFKSAKEHGAEEKREEDRPSNSGRTTFIGAGYRLGETNEDTTVIQGAQRAVSKKQEDRKLKLWKNGFSVDDGPLRDYNDPQNRQFLDSVSKGEVPQELVRETRGGEVNLDMEDHRAEDFVKPKLSVKAFSGAGHMLGSPAPGVTQQSDTPTGGDQAPAAVKVDESQPVTNVQLRLADGNRIVLKLNHTHKVSDIRNAIISSHPQYTQSTFCLMTTFPNKELQDESQTLKEANLLNAVIVQRLK